MFPFFTCSPDRSRSSSKDRIGRSTRKFDRCNVAANAGAVACRHVLPMGEGCPCSCLCVPPVASCCNGPGLNGGRAVLKKVQHLRMRSAAGPSRVRSSEGGCLQHMQIYIGGHGAAMCIWCSTSGGAPAATEWLKMTWKY